MRVLLFLTKTELDWSNSPWEEARVNITFYQAEWFVLIFRTLAEGRSRPFRSISAPAAIIFSYSSFRRGRREQELGCDGFGS